MDSARPHERPTAFDRMLTPVHRWIWRDTDRRVQKLLRFSRTETDGGRDILRAAEVTSDPLLRRLYLEHAIDEFRHGVLFRHRAAALLKVSRAVPIPGSKVTGLPQVATVSMIYRLTVNRTAICWLSFIYLRSQLPAASPFIAM